MSETFSGEVDFKNTGDNVVLKIDPEKRSLNIYTADGKTLIAFFSAEEIKAPRLSCKDTGALKLFDINGKEKIRFFADAGSGQLGGYGLGGSLHLHGPAGAISGSGSNAVIFLSGESGSAWVGGQGKEGSITVKDGKNNTAVRLSGDGSIRAGGDGKPGDLWLYRALTNNPDANKKDATIHLSGTEGALLLGGKDKPGTITLFDANKKALVVINGGNGDILLDSADCAEDFDVDDPDLEKGSVLVLGDQPGKLRVSNTAYDTRVAGILSGAGNYRPAIVLDRKPEKEGRRPVALVGKVWCKAEAQSAPIGVGSLLTTSSLPGHAMAAIDRERAFGAVLGKALAPLAAGVGVLPVLVSLQ